MRHSHKQGGCRKAAVCSGWWKFCHCRGKILILMRGCRWVNADGFVPMCVCEFSALKGSWHLWELQCQGGEQPSEGVQWSPGLGRGLSSAALWGSLSETCAGGSPTSPACAWALQWMLSSHPVPGCHQSNILLCARQNENLSEWEQCLCFHEELWRGGKHLLAPSTDVPLFF